MLREAILRVVRLGLAVCATLFCEVYAVSGMTGNACSEAPLASETLRSTVRLPLNGCRAAYTELVSVFQV